MPFAIQGLFFQENEYFDIAYKPIKGAVPVIGRALFQYAYSGYIWQNPENSWKRVGALQDYYGRSELKEISILDIQVSFIKKYENRDDWILYTFTKKDGKTWVGQYKRSKCGTGVTRCIITEITDDFFFPEPIVVLLGLEKAHEW